MLNLIPKPASIISNSGEYRLSASTTISATFSHPEVKELAEYLSSRLERSIGWKPAVLTQGRDTEGIMLTLDPGLDLGEGFRQV